MSLDIATDIIAPTCVGLLLFVLAEAIYIVKIERQKRHLEDALSKLRETCAEEINQYKQTMTSMRKRHEEELQQKEARIEELVAKVSSSGLKLPPYVPMHERTPKT